MIIAIARPVNVTPMIKHAIVQLLSTGQKSPADRGSEDQGSLRRRQDLRGRDVMTVAMVTSISCCPWPQQPTAL